MRAGMLSLATVLVTTLALLVVMTGPAEAVEEVKADFSADPLCGAFPLEVQFTDNSLGNPHGWYWTFGDGGTSNEQNPKHTYTNAGVYTVTLKAWDGGGTSNTTQEPDYIRVVDINKCGNRIVDTGERCDPPGNNTACGLYYNAERDCGILGICTDDCCWCEPPPEYCGNGVIDPGEDCETNEDCLEYEVVYGGEWVCRACRCVIKPCFIATAAYGTPTAGELDTLRAFRDEVLLQNSLGSGLVALYYEVSPPLADFISGHEPLRMLVRDFLVEPVVWIVETTGVIWRD